VTDTRNGVVPTEQIARVVNALQGSQSRELGRGIPRPRAFITVTEVHVGLELRPAASQLQLVAQNFAEVVQKWKLSNVFGETVNRAILSLLSAITPILFSQPQKQGRDHVGGRK